jgi:hypothetical protein
MRIQMKKFQILKISSGGLIDFGYSTILTTNFF